MTNNAVVFLRGDRINTNIVNSVKSDVVEVRYFKRSAWQGCIVIDRNNKLTFSVASKNTLERIPQKKRRSCPHFLQTLLNTENKNEIGIENKCRYLILILHLDQCLRMKNMRMTLRR